MATGPLLNAILLFSLSLFLGGIWLKSHGDPDGLALFSSVLWQRLCRSPSLSDLPADTPPLLASSPSFLPGLDEKRVDEEEQEEEEEEEEEEMDSIGVEKK
jgi:hypothetical protein